jgi:tRNA-splicing ligase RtcB
MSNHLVRLARAFARRGIHLEYADGVYTLRNEHAHAQVLLPATLPLEEKAVRQLLDFASVGDGGAAPRVCKACATPDFHPGAIAPVGTIVATDAEFVIPAAVGTDINCGMRLATLGLPLSALAPHKTALLARLKRVLLESGRDVPNSAAAYRALFGTGSAAFVEMLPRLGLWARAPRERLLQELSACVGLASFGGSVQHAPQALVESDGRAVLRDPCLGTPGGGNHFVELQVVDEVLERRRAWAAGLKAGDVVLMVHSGSRDVGFHVGGRWMDRARDAWPAGRRHPRSGLYGLGGTLARDYLQAMGGAARYAWANRMTLAELVRDEMAQLGLLGESRLVVDVPHNVVLAEQGLNIHRKGATPARDGDLVLIPGSMGDASYVATGLGHADWLWSCSHGAGRAVRRQQTRALKPAPTGSLPSWHCVTLKEERLLEEAPSAYKPIGPVIEAQEQAGLITPVARLRPWVTFKA